MICISYITLVKIPDYISPTPNKNSLISHSHNIAAERQLN